MNAVVEQERGIGPVSQVNVTAMRKSVRTMGHLWNDSRFRRLDDLCKLLAVYCLMGEQTQELGIQKFSILLAAEDLGWTIEEAHDRMAQVVAAFGWSWDPEARVLWMVDFLLRRSKPTQAVVRRGLAQAGQLPESPVLDQFSLLSPSNLPGFIPPTPKPSVKAVPEQASASFPAAEHPTAESPVVAWEPVSVAGSADVEIVDEQVVESEAQAVVDEWVEQVPGGAPNASPPSIVRSQPPIQLIPPPEFPGKAGECQDLDAFLDQMFTPSSLCPPTWKTPFQKQF